MKRLERMEERLGCERFGNLDAPYTEGAEFPRRRRCSRKGGDLMKIKANVKAGNIVWGT